MGQSYYFWLSIKNSERISNTICKYKQSYQVNVHLWMSKSTTS